MGNFDDIHENVTQTNASKFLVFHKICKDYYQLVFKSMQ